MKKIFGNTTHTFKYGYDANGNVSSLFESPTNITTKFYYDTIGRLTRAVSSNGFARSQRFDEFNRINYLSYSDGTTTHNYSYLYDHYGRISGVVLPNSKQLSYTYDGFNRLISSSVNTTTPIISNYVYGLDMIGRATHRITGFTNNLGSFGYQYDANDNIGAVLIDGMTHVSYTYDELNQLKTYTTPYFETYEYTYDNYGNILNEKFNGNIIKSYTYGNSSWGDLLTAFNGQNITYDNIGNPLTYRDGWAFTWSGGRQLATATNTGKSPCVPMAKRDKYLKICKDKGISIRQLSRLTGISFNVIRKF